MERLPLKTYRQMDWAQHILGAAQHCTEQTADESVDDIATKIAIQASLATLGWILGEPENRGQVQVMLESIREGLQQDGYLLLPEPRR